MMSKDEVTQQIEHKRSLTDKIYQRWKFDVVRGRFPLKMILDRKIHDAAEAEMIEVYSRGELNHAAMKNLIEDQLIHLSIYEKKVEDTPESIRIIIQKIIDDGFEFDRVTGNVSFNEKLLETECRP